MSTLSTTAAAVQSAAHLWFDEHLAELRRRCRQFVRRFPRHERDEAVAEMLGQIWQYARGAERRRVLQRLTPFTLVQFFGRRYAAGRRLCGAHSADVLATTGQRRHRLRIVSLDQPRRLRTPGRESRLPLSEVLADRRAVPPPENCRRDLDYPLILRRHRASPKARQVFAYLAQTHGQGRQVELARQLGVVPSRVVQLKQQLARCLAAGGYGPTPAATTSGGVA